MLTIREKIVARLQADSQLQALLEGTDEDRAIYPRGVDAIERFPCLVHETIDESFLTTPRNKYTMDLQISIFSKLSRKNVEDIFTRVNFLLNYYKESLEIIYMRLSSAPDVDEEDRKVYSKKLRYIIWAKDI